MSYWYPMYIFEQCCIESLYNDLHVIYGVRFLYMLFILLYWCPTCIFRQSCIEGLCYDPPYNIRGVRFLYIVYFMKELMV